LKDALKPIEGLNPQVQVKSLNRLRNVFWGLGVACFAFMMAITIFVQLSNPDHPTPQYPEFMRFNGIVMYMTVTQERVLKGLFVVFFVCSFGGVSIGLSTPEEKRTGVPTSHHDETGRD
jgi:hypothetical protein